eukprot:TRINITY_DN400_c0_g2_i11.p1 TRINITY_DN400_c0_g2~~TRINITY_DN400_c0_g2_i11.p1  ORF type:complete len:306 (+),score=36.45 TRINITY_DN400_c0_g2_i11:72-920(+)
MSSCLNCSELCAMIAGWLFSAGVWLHFIIISVCEPDLSSDYALCNYYSYSCTTKNNEVKQFRNIYFFVVLAALYVLCCILANRSPTRRYLNNIIDIPAEKYQRQLFKARPTCWLNIECYHRGDKNRRIVTKKEREEFKFTTFRSHCVVGAEYSTAMRLRISKNLKFLDKQTEAAHKEQLDSFVKRHASDKYQDIESEVAIPGYRDKYVLAFSNPANRTFWYSKSLYYLCVFLTFGMLYSTCVICSTKAVDIIVTKEVGLDQNSDHNPPDEEIADTNEEIEHV